MRKIIVLLITCLLIATSAFASEIDLASMSFEELHALKQAVDLEYNARPEAEGKFLTKGNYTVGKDILPGQYYIGVAEPTETESRSLVCIYEDLDTFKQEEPGFTKYAKYEQGFILGYDPMLIVLDEGNILNVRNGKVLLKASKFNPEDYFKYEAPEGTFIPAGTYNVGDDIPVGTYNLYPGTISGGEYKDYSTTVNEDGSIKKSPKNGWLGNSMVYVRKEPECVVIELNDGDILEVITPIILAKPEKLQFN